MAQWDVRYAALAQQGLCEPPFGGRPGRHVDDGDTRLLSLRFDNSVAALNLWNFLLTEQDRLFEAAQRGVTIIGAMKDLGTVPVMAYSLENTLAFYPDGAWWIPCVMEANTALLAIASSLGVGETFCPVRAMLGAFVTGAHFPVPDLCVCSVGATCDDFSTIAQRLNGLGHPVVWWEIPARREPLSGEERVVLPGGIEAPADQVSFVKLELDRVRRALERCAHAPLDDRRLSAGIAAANRIRHLLRALRETVFTAPVCPLPALELLIAEMLALHFCSDRDQTADVLSGLLEEVGHRVGTGAGYGSESTARIFWVNPVADLRVMNLLEEAQARVCGTEYLFTHALDAIPEDVAPLEALARSALADPMAGTMAQRAARICSDAKRFGSEAVIVSKIPGASHCALEGAVIVETVSSRLGLPVIELEIPPISDALVPALQTRIEALVETIHGKRR